MITIETLYKQRKGKIIYGVCSGIAQQTGYDPWFIRLCFVAALVPLTIFAFVTYMVIANRCVYEDECPRLAKLKSGIENLERDIVNLRLNL